MIANYHTHTMRCNHAVGTMREYVDNALERQLKIFGFSDHTPQYFPDGYCTFMRMHTQELPQYCADVRALQKEFQGKIQIPLGLEVEYYPAYWKDLLHHAQDEGVEYMILGQHWLGNELGEPGSSAATTDERLLKQYCFQVMDGLETGKFTYIAHPDLLNFVGERKIYRKHMGALIRAAKESGTPLEINILGRNNGRHYPNEAFFEIVAEESCPVILGMDAHAPEHVLNAAVEEELLEMVKRLGLELLETVELRKI